MNAKGSSRYQYFTVNNDRVSAIDTIIVNQKGTSESGISINAVAGTGTAGFAGDNGLAASAQLYNPWDVAFHPSTKLLYITDRNNHRIRKIDSSGIITTVAGTGTAGSSGDNGLATSAQLNQPLGLAFHPSTELLYFSDNTNHRIRKVEQGAPPRLS